MAVKVEDIELQISADGAKAVVILDELTKSLGSLKATVSGGLIPSSAINSIKRLGDAVSNVNIVMLADIAESLERIKEATSGISNVKITMPNIAADATGDARPAELTESAEAIEEVSDALEEAADNAKKVYPEFVRDEDAIRNMGNAAKKSAFNFTKLAESFKRILFYRVIRTVIKEITQAFKEGINNAYQYSKAIAGPLAKNMDALATSVLFLKNGLGAAMAPIINALTPVVTALADAVANLGNTIAGVIALLSGQGTYIKAIKNMTEYADATKGAAKAQRQLLGFDELNVLSDKGGSGGSSLDYSKMFETVNTSDFVKNLGKSFAELPATISQKIKDALSKISQTIASVNWNSVPGEIANALKTAFSTFDFAGVFTSVGELIGSALAASIKFGQGILGVVLENFDSSIDKAFANIDSDSSILEIGAAFVTGLFNGIINAFSSVNTWLDQNVITPLKNGVLSGFRTVWGAVTDDGPMQAQFVLSKLRGWWAIQKGKFFNTEVWKNTFKPLWEGLDSAVGEIKRIWNEIQAWLDKHGLKFEIDFGGLFGNTPFGQALGTGKKVNSLVNTLKGLFFADGGYPATGSMFVAGEAGPELVSQVGNRTGVINSDQFGAMIMAAADSIINAVLASGQGIAGAVEANKPEFNINGRQLARAIYPDMQKEGKRIGPSAVSVV